MRQLSLSELRTGILSARERIGPNLRSSQSIAWGLIDQTLISGVNFSGMLILARQLGPSDFGVFVLAHTFLLFVNSVQASLLTQPHNVLGAQRSGRTYVHYTTTIGIAQLAFSLTVGASSALAGLILFPRNSTIFALLLALAGTTITWQLQEFCRRILYTELNYRGAVVNDLFAYGGQLLAIMSLWWFDALTPVKAIVSIGAGSVVGVLLGLLQTRKVLTSKLDLAAFKLELHETWTFGKWPLGGSLLSWVSVQLYPVITAYFLGFGATGGLRASQNLVAPCHILLKSMEAALPAQASRISKEYGREAVRSYIGSVVKPFATIITVYLLAISVAAQPLMELFLGEIYGPYWWIVPLLAIVYLGITLSTVADILLRSVGVTHPLIRANAFSALLVLTVGVWLVMQFGLAGAALGLIFQGIAFNGVLWYHVRLEYSRP